MEHCSKKPGDEKKIPPFGPDSIELAMRLRIRDTIEALVKEELDAALGAMKSVRVGETRQGYRHGTRERTLTTSRGPTTIAMPRARVQQPEGRRRGGAVYLSPLPQLAMEGAADDERVGADQRGIPATNEDAGELARA